jgi:hypothetical protein
LNYSGMTMSIIERVKKRELLIWASVIPLAICLVYSSFYLVIGRVLSPLLDVAVWGIAVFIVLARLGYNLELNMVRGYYRSVVGVGLLVAICGLAVGVVLVALGFVSQLGLVPISILILSFCIVFSPDFFGMDRIPFILRLILSGLIIYFLVALAVFLV